ncbi:MAG: PilZ domain-containing protein, partial [Acidobacteria bacterium]|nr:PilZ domain-containing protein [Acidobacteriota bacterium]
TKTIPIGTRLRVLFHLEDEDEALKAEADVIYSVLKLGVGIRFLDLGLYERKCIEAYVATARK